MTPETAISTRDLVITGGGEMGRLMRSFNWAATPVGPVEDWPQSLRTAVSMMLASGYPMYIAWGPELVQFYNDAYRPVLGAKHPAALGQTTPECWSEIWDSMLAPMFNRVVGTGVEVSAKDLMFPLERHGFTEECYFDFSYSPIRDESYQVGGILVTCSETTSRVLSERRLRILRDLADRSSAAASAEEACSIAGEVMAEHGADIPFCLIYLAGPDGQIAQLAGACGLEPGHPAAPAEVCLLPPEPDSGWPIRDVWLAGVARIVQDVRRRFGDLPGSPWPEPPRTAAVLPFGQSGAERAAGVLVIGVSPRLALDAEYRSFLGLVAGQVGTAVATARSHAEERRRAEALAEVDRAKTAFFGNISHEFRTPLSLLLGPIEDVLSDRAEPPPPAQRARLEIAHRNGLRLLKLVNTLLDFSRIEAGRVRAVYEPVDLASYTAELASSFRSAMEKAGLRFTVECSPLSRPIYLDREMWEKVVLNLLSNALKYTFEGEVCVALRETSEGAELRVSDSGTGIPEAELPHIFERFHRVEGARARTQEGSGIGLALVHELVRLQGGTIDVESTVGGGTTFSVRLLAGTSHLPSERVNAARTATSTPAGSQAYVEEATRWLSASSERAAAPAESGPAAPRRTDGQRFRLLVADDNADMREYLERLLGAAYEVEVVGDGEAALETARQRSPDLILTDVMMPGLDGFGLLRALRADAATQLIPVIMLSARAGEESRVEGLEAGADDYLVKPFTARELLARVRSNLELAQLRQEARLEVDRERARLHQLFQEAPALMCLLTGPEHVFTLANARYYEIVGNRELIGRPVREALPEVEGQGFFELLDRVYERGETVVGNEARILLARGPGGSLEEAFIDFIYAPLRRRDGTIEGVFAHGFEVTEQVLARNRVEELAEQRQAALRVRDEFLSIASHELRTPVAGVTGAAQLLKRLRKRGHLDERRLDEFLDRILDATDRLATLTQDLLDVSRLQTGRLPLNCQATSFVELLRAAMERNGSSLDLGRVRTEIVDGDVLVSVDRGRIEQVVTNLLENAVKYSPPGAEMVIRVSSGDGGIVCEVADHGIGLPPGAEQTIFEPFGRAANAAEQQGMGLGLYICRQIVEQHGGRIWATSAGEHRGTTVGFWLPAVAQEVVGAAQAA